MKQILLIVLVVLAAAAAGYYFFIRAHPVKTAAENVKLLHPEDIQSQVQRLGEEIYKQKYYAPLIATYKKMLEEYPDNLELKKQLAFAYFGAGQYAEAKPILDEIAKTPLANEEVLRELEFIKKQNPLP